MDRTTYLLGKLQKTYECDNCVKFGKKCFGCSFWEGITIKDPDMIPECTKCQEDTARLKKEAKNAKGQVELEAKCSRYCLWWDFHHNRRKQTCPFVYYRLDTKCVPPTKRYWYYEPS